MEAELVTIREVLSNAENLKWSDALFLSDAEEWTLDSRGIIWDPDDVESDEAEVPEIAERNGLYCSMNISTIQEIVENAKQQAGNCSVEILFEAFLYYWDQDAFLSLE